jgi:hypothetical protein
MKTLFTSKQLAFWHACDLEKYSPEQFSHHTVYRQKRGLETSRVHEVYYNSSSSSSFHLVGLSRSQWSTSVNRCAASWIASKQAGISWPGFKRESFNLKGIRRWPHGRAAQLSTQELALLWVLSRTASTSSSWGSQRGIPQLSICCWALEQKQRAWSVACQVAWHCSKRPKLSSCWHVWASWLTIINLPLPWSIPLSVLSMWAPSRAACLCPVGYSRFGSP